VGKTKSTFLLGFYDSGLNHFDTVWVKKTKNATENRLGKMDNEKHAEGAPYGSNPTVRQGAIEGRESEARKSKLRNRKQQEPLVCTVAGI
jgi:hypothetical protein